jgi:hypothetical protein
VSERGLTRGKPNVPFALESNQLPANQVSSALIGDLKQSKARSARVIREPQQCDSGWHEFGASNGKPDGDGSHNGCDDGTGENELGVTHSLHAA